MLDGCPETLGDCPDTLDAFLGKLSMAARKLLQVFQKHLMVVQNFFGGFGSRRRTLTLSMCEVAKSDVVPGIADNDVVFTDQSNTCSQLYVIAQSLLC